MFLRRRWRSRADSSSLPYRHWLPRFIAACLLALLPLASLWGIGTRHLAWQSSSSWASGLSAFFARGAGGLGVLVAGGNDVRLWGLRCGWLALVIVALWAARHAMFAYSAYKPGPVDVQALTADVPQGNAQPPVAALTAWFRKELSETELYAPTNLPAETPAANFLDLLGDVNLAPKNLATSLLRLASRIRPRIAYRVSGVLTVRDESPECGLTVTLTSFALGGSRAETFWEMSWEEVTRTAAYWVVASLLPITRAGRRAPWRDWRGRDLPPRLFAAYQKARLLSRARNFDGALESYYEALRYDPANVHLRNQVGSTQEKLGLYLDALETYHSALAIGWQGSERDNRRLQARPWSPCRIGYQCFLWGQAGALQARYRFAVVLGTAEQTAQQWCKAESTPHARAIARDRIRKTLAPAFAKRYLYAVEDLPGGTNEEELRKLLELENGGADRSKLVALVLQRASAVEMCRLAEDYPIGRLLRKFRHDDTSLTRSAARVNRDVWGPLRLAQVWKDARKAHPSASFPMLPDRSTLHWRKGVMKAADKMRKWIDSPKADDLKTAVRRAKLYVLYGWQGCYNAACAYAVALQGVKNEQLERDLADLACHELKEAARRAESGYTRIRRSWLLFDDPDLTALRKTPNFVRFGREVFPHPWPDLPSPRETPPKTVTAPPSRRAAVAPTDIEMTAYDRELLQEIGTVMERVWHHRSTQTPTDLHTAEHWLARERQLWEYVDVVAAGEARNWPNRAQLLQEVEQTTSEELPGRVELPTTVPELDTVITTATNESSEAWTEPMKVEHWMWELPERLDQELRQLHKLVAEDGIWSPIKRSTGLLRDLESYEASGWQALSRPTVDPICTRYAALWQAFASLFSGLSELTDGPAGPDGFDTALRHLHQPIPLITLGR